MHRIHLFVCLIILFTVCQSCQKDEEIFNPDIAYGSLTDIEKNTYRTVKIGDQEWMAENLRTTRYTDGTAVYQGDETSKWSGQEGSYCWYDNDARAYKTVYGALYNWSAVRTGKLCPAGWHVPGIEEWQTLENYLFANGYNYDGITTEKMIAKSLSSASRWEASADIGTPGNNPSVNNGSGFSALPAGYRDPTHGWNTFNGTGISCGWWSSTDYGGSFALHCSLSNHYSSLHIDDPKQLITILWSYGFSVRCVKD